MYVVTPTYKHNLHKKKARLVSAFEKISEHVSLSKNGVVIRRNIDHRLNLSGGNFSGLNFIDWWLKF